MTVFLHTHFMVLGHDDDVSLAYRDLNGLLMPNTPPKIFPRVTGTKFLSTKSTCGLREKEQA